MSRSPGRNDRVVLTALAAWPNEALSADRLVDALWGERPPRSSSKVVQNVVLRLRKHLGGSLIETRPGGYALRASDVDIDARRFELMVREGRAHAQDGDLVAASAELAAAVDLWRGPPLPELCEWPPGRSEAARLEELHRCVTEELAELELACGHHHQWIPVLESLVSEEPLRERRWALLMVALYRCGRQADALRAYQRARVALNDPGLDGSVAHGRSATEQLVRDLLPEGIGPLDLGEHRLKDIARPERIFQVTAPDLPVEFPSLRSADIQPTNLPYELSTFVGRGLRAG